MEQKYSTFTRLRLKLPSFLDAFKPPTLFNVVCALVVSFRKFAYQIFKLKLCKCEKFNAPTYRKEGCCLALKWIVSSCLFCYTICLSFILKRYANICIGYFFMVVSWNGCPHEHLNTFIAYGLDTYYIFSTEFSAFHSNIM